jgi:hypothetical protein
VNQSRNNITRLLQSSRRENRNTRISMKNRTSRNSGFTLVEIMIVVAAGNV